MDYEYDILNIGMGPAGMAVAAMGTAMGLKACSIEKQYVGGECMNVGCIPSKALLRIASTRHIFKKLEEMELADTPLPVVKRPFAKIQGYIKYINEKKTMSMFDAVDLVLGEGDASFVDPHTVSVGDKKISAKYIMICTGTEPMVPPIRGIGDVEFLTNQNVFDLDEIPGSMTIIGGGAIGSEMAQAFSRLGSKVTIVQMDPHLLPFGEPDAGNLLEEVFKKEGIDVYNSRIIEKIEKEGSEIALYTDRGEKIVSEKLLMAAGRKASIDSLKLENAGVKYTPRGISVNKYLQTSRSHIFAAGDCNGNFLLTHAAMHQGMVALMNSMLPRPFKMDFRKYVVPWTVFTEPEVSHVGKLESELQKQGKKYEVIEAKYEDYGAAIAEGVGIGFVKVLASPAGKIYGARIIGEGAGEMISEWGLAIQKKIRLHDIMLLQHSFPTMSYLNKRIGETWMMGKMKSERLKKIIRIFT